MGDKSRRCVTCEGTRAVNEELVLRSEKLRDAADLLVAELEQELREAHAYIKRLRKALGEIADGPPHRLLAEELRDGLSTREVARRALDPLEEE